MFPKLVTALICCGVATLLLTTNTLLRSQSRVVNLSIPKLVALIATIAFPLTLVEAILFRRVVLLDPFGDATATLLRLLHRA
jgi:hypothetical protein